MTLATKVSTALIENVSPVSCDSLVLQGARCEWGAGVSNLVLSLSHSLILVTGSSMWHLVAKNFLHEAASMSAAGCGEVEFIEQTMNVNMYCDILKQSMIPYLWKLGQRAAFQHDNDPKHTG
ncbi:hypothetical protein ILYODFUR_003782 [Ilyodon furcidens]|uniref:Uncharacterized protein n=1 Tax=Ilyodon furcidens TaxID=33524 RepID=A0ABV0U3L2_9TELE